MSIKLIATLTFPADQQDKARDALAELVEKSQSDKGCLQYEFFAIDKNVAEGEPVPAGDFMVLEEWWDEEALNEHVASDHFQGFLSAFGEGEMTLNIQRLLNP
ncbi:MULTISPECIES: putative quinol monooxygenase [unclassified Cobetia]|uniref:putative quinol monooxygenase n=1 Tax=unclassified Cobetia TaxID=2609414 RepID=UPI00178CC608|nr:MULTISPECIES: antibiotic biosynthesis monooxygenase family protein [unclassified Cobetia]MBE2168127.1 antibiotic biosynthesis monooxygenase [Cobetia sp. 2AS1]MDH2446549.1 antibiotic biosynthesis monooxygenase [Cobetia sp. 2AS]